ncbi:class I histocompatibility antigen, F10 alpha chain-like [Terrapene carolina triunguis]|uniref:class I histocompatibility antigen, F10 alpha chain-like n=1 Tax=Terrapene triunguis TaxID=2587831 RepID=UPI0011564D02|nr:class I histocompatibility antigen, F10 alpha chain-like [Terrapene carolina triunguis]
MSNQGRHSLAVLVTGVINEDGTYHFTMITSVDDVQIAHYSSDAREFRPTQEWAAQALGAKYLQEKTQQFWWHEEVSKVETRWWMQLHNQTGGIHTGQLHASCALSDQAPMDPRFQYAYDGRDFISFDNQTGTWVAAVQPAFAPKQRWETDKIWTPYVRRYLQHECLETLRRLVQGGRMLLEQQVPPEVLVSRRDAPDGSVTLSCRARGFYPRPIHVSWVRDGEDILAETDSSGILPNADGTYYTQSSLEISPQQDGHRYACRVEHSSLPEPRLAGVSADALGETFKAKACGCPRRMPQQQLPPHESRLRSSSHKERGRFCLQLIIGNKPPVLGAVTLPSS